MEFEATAPESTESSAVESSQGESASAASTAVSGDSAQAQSPTEAPVYQPNFKFSAYEKEHEFDEFIRPVVKDKLTEEKLRDLYSKAYGLEPMKAKYNKLQEEYAPIKERYENLYGNVSRLGQFMEKGDLDNFFLGVGLKEDQVFKWALHKLQLSEMPIEQRQAYQELSERRRNEALLSEQYQATQAQLQELKQQQVLFELDQNLGRAEVKAMADAFESKMGQPGAFRQEVIQTARSIYRDTGRDMTPVEAINEVLNRYKPFLAGSAAQASAQVSGRGSGQAQAPVIPNVTGKSTSPAARHVRSLDELKRLATESD